MIKAVKYDFYRLFKSPAFYAILSLSIFVSGTLSLILRSDIRIGISIFGNLTAFKSIESLVIIGTQYYKGLGFLIAIVIAVFLGQEYLWKTLFNKCALTRSRISVYLAKVLISCSVSAIIYIAFVLSVILLSGEAKMLLAPQSILMMFSGIFAYIALGAVFALITILMQNNVYGLIACLAYVPCSEIFVSLAQSTTKNLAFVEIFTSHSIYGMSQTLSMSMTVYDTLYLCANMIFIVVLCSVVGCLVFKRQEI